LSNRYVAQIINGGTVSCRFDPYGIINQYIISTNESQTSIRKGNNNFNKIEEFLSSENISPEYAIEWVEEVRDKDGNILHHNTNIGPFVDSCENKISTEIKNKINNDEVDVRNSDGGFQAVEMEVSVFLPRSYRLTATGSLPIEKYSFDGSKIGLPFEIRVELLQGIEDDYFDDNEIISSSLRNTKGVVLRFLIDGKNAKKVYNWSKDNLDYELDALNQSLEYDYALYKRNKNRGPRTNWYFDWINTQQYIWVPILHITNKVVGLLNQQAHRKTTSLISKDDIGDIACIRVRNNSGQKFIWPVSNLKDSQINIFPEELDWNYKPIDIAFKRIRFLFDQGLYFESLVVTQAILESIVNGMLEPSVVVKTFDRQELKWEQKYRYLRQFFDHELSSDSWLKSLFNGGLKAIYDYRNHFSHDFLEHQPDYSFNIGVYQEVKDLIHPFVDTHESGRFLQDVSSMYSKRGGFLSFLSVQASG